MRVEDHPASAGSVGAAGCQSYQPYHTPIPQPTPSDREGLKDSLCALMFRTVAPGANEIEDAADAILAWIDEQGYRRSSPVAPSEDTGALDDRTLIAMAKDLRWYGDDVLKYGQAVRDATLAAVGRVKP